ncbi:unnamed protein product (macronuclear) [Paramecium tetraurelia]|uniref:non-specific serine/threonine protein kinase n=1 Tax=Paramecium tetraurelia TaxID=5888 RepID=A0DFX0_PARTE|nr:uncharacterized protein GSPATT00002065001 [Paramecium tetraurelia]CAK81937.1 unnamed protein product [Paramecium tetraurelia]|eukprot:XP_001449334.1 hypothetical protein (macronuclear) [Paramecium tetraurelia strain d4-2]
MGNSNGQQSLLVLDQNYAYQTLKTHPVFGEIKLYKHSETGRKIAIINKQIFESEQHNMKQETYLKRKSYDNINLLKVLGFQKLIANDLCSQIRYLSIQVEYYENTITQFKEKFTEKELYYLIFSLCDAMDYCKQNNNEITDLHPSKILVTDDGFVKLVDNIVALEAISNFHQVKYNDRQVEYLAPEQLELFSGLKNKINQEKANIFCLGLLLSQLITKQPVSDYYLEEFVNLNLLFKRLDQKFAQYSYSSSLYALLKEMLAHDPEERLSTKQVLAKKQYHHFVSNLDGDSVDFAEHHHPDSILQSPNSYYQEEQQVSYHRKKESILSVKATNEEFQIADQSLQKRIDQALAESNKLLDQLSVSSPVTKFQSRATINGIYDSVQNPLVQLTESRIKRLIENSEEVIEKSLIQSKTCM